MKDDDCDDKYYCYEKYQLEKVLSSYENLVDYLKPDSDYVTGPIIKEQDLLDFIHRLYEDLIERNIGSVTNVDIVWQVLTNSEDIDLVRKTVSCLLMLVERDGALEDDLIIAALLSYAKHSDNPEFTSADVICILSELSYSEENFITPEVQTSLLFVLPKIFSEYFTERSQYMPEISLIMKRLLDEIGSNYKLYDTSNIELVIEVLCQNGTIGEILRFLKEFSLGEVKDCSYIVFERLVDVIMLLLKHDFDLKAILPVAEYLLNILKTRNITVLSSQDPDQQNNIMSLLQQICEIVSFADTTVLLGISFFESLLKALIVNTELTKEITQIIIDGLRKLSNLLNSGLKTDVINGTFTFIVSTLEPLILAPTDVLCIQYCRIYCFCLQSHRLPENKDDPHEYEDRLLFLTKMKVFITVLNCENREEMDSFVLDVVQFPFSVCKQIEKCSEKNRKILTTLVEDNLPDMVAKVKEPFRFEFCHFLTQLMTVIMDDVTDFFTSRWDIVRNVITHYYTNLTNRGKRTVHSTRLSLTFKLLSMEFRDRFVFTLVRADLGDLQLDNENMEVAREILISFIINDIKIALQDEDCLFSYNYNVLPHVEEITALMAEMVRSRMPSIDSQLFESVIHLALDVSEKYCSAKNKENIDEFIRYFSLINA